MRPHVSLHSILLATLVFGTPPLAANPTPAAGALVNSSIRAPIGPKPLILGVVIDDDYRVVLFRAVGPGLSAFGVEDVVPDPRIVVFDQLGNRLGASARLADLADSEYALIERATTDAGAFPLARDSADSVVLLAVSGAVTCHVTRESAGGGEVLVEAYAVPWTSFDRSTVVVRP